MNRPLAAFLIGAAIFSQVALAGDSRAEVGRYQIIAKVPVPNQAGKMQEQTVLLDTETGRTWRMALGGQSGKNTGLHWVPLDIKLADPVNAAASSGASANQTARDTNPAFKNRKNRLGEEYDNDP